MCTDCAQTEPEKTGRSISRRLALGGLMGTAALVGASGTAFAGTTAPANTGLGGKHDHPARLELVMLGTRAGPPVNPYRTGISSALVVDGSTYLVDCGRSAVSQYVHAGLTLASMRAMFITHLHVDHLADYYNFFLLGGGPANSLGDMLPLTGVGVYGPGRAGGLPPKFGGGQAPTINPANPTPGLIDLTNSCADAYAYSSNVFMRDTGIPDIRTLADIHEIVVPNVGANFQNTAPAMAPFLVMEDDKVRVTAILVPHGPVFPAFAYRFDTEYGSVTFSGDTTYTPNIPTLAKHTDLLVHEAMNVEGFTGPAALVSHLLTSHVDVQKVGGIAAAAGAKRLVLSHLADLAQDPIDTRKWTKWARQGYDGPVTVGQDLQRIRLR